MDSLSRHKAELMKDPEFHKEYEVIQGEYQAILAIAKARAETGLTQKELAERSGLTQSNISRIETGRCVPNVRTLQQLAQGFGKTLHIEFR